MPAMQKLLILLIISANHNQHVRTNFVKEYLMNKMTAFKEYVINHHSEMKTLLKETLHRTRIPKNRTSHDKPKEDKELPRRTIHSPTMPQLAAGQGRIVETHVTMTSDGYILTLHRLRPNLPKDQHNPNPRTVLLHHGLLGSSADWIQLGSKFSLPYILSDAGHDIWLANCRGNYYSRTHTTTAVNTDLYWDFSWQEIGEYDLPAIIDYISSVNNNTEPIDYIGHSMGATALLVMLSTAPNYNSRFRMAFLLAPLAFMNNTRGPLRRLAEMNRANITSLLGRGEFMPSAQTSSQLKSLCENIELYCRNPLFFLTGGPKNNDVKHDRFLKLLDKYVPAGGSVKTIKHFLQLIRNGKFHRFGKPDFSFDLQQIDVPMIILSSDDDYISNATDNQMLYRNLNSTVVHLVLAKRQFSHTEFAWGFTADELVFKKIKSMIDIGPKVLTGGEI